MEIFRQIAAGLKKAVENHRVTKGPECRRVGSRPSQHALPIVDQRSAFDPKTAKLKEVADAYRKYGIPMIQGYTEDPISIGNALLNLATMLLRAKLPADQAALPTNILNTAVQLAVTAIRA